MIIEKMQQLRKGIILSLILTLPCISRLSKYHSEMILQRLFPYQPTNIKQFIIFFFINIFLKCVKVEQLKFTKII